MNRNSLSNGNSNIVVENYTDKLELANNTNDNNNEDIHYCTISRCISKPYDFAENIVEDI